MKITHARKLLPEKLKNISDQELEMLIKELEILAEIMIETFERNGSNKQLGVIDSSKRWHDNEN